jgi:hypothetical protein
MLRQGTGGGDQAEMAPQTLQGGSPGRYSRPDRLAEGDGLYGDRCDLEIL